MKNKFNAVTKKLVKVSTVLLPAFALTFAMSPCIFKMYEPKMPERLKK